MGTLREPEASTRSISRILGDLDADEGLGDSRPQVDDVPLRLTEERILSESKRNPRLKDLDSAPLAVDLAARPIEPEPPPERASTTAVRPESVPSPAAPASRARPRSALRRAVVIALVSALAGAAADRYIALRQNSQLPGAETVRALQAEAIRARSELQQLGQSELSREVIALGHKARPALAEASHRGRQLLSAILDRYQRWRARG